MANEALKQVFKNLNAKIVREVDPDSVIDELFGKDVIGDADYHELYKIADPKSRCRKLLSLLHHSSHPETFIQLRLALLDEYPSIVDEIDQQRTSLTNPEPQQQFHMSQSAEGKFLL